MDIPLDIVPPPVGDVGVPRQAGIAPVLVGVDLGTPPDIGVEVHEAMQAGVIGLVHDDGHHLVRLPMLHANHHGLADPAAGSDPLANVHVPLLAPDLKGALPKRNSGGEAPPKKPQETLPRRHGYNWDDHEDETLKLAYGKKAPRGHRCAA